MKTLEQMFKETLGELIFKTDCENTVAFEASDFRLEMEAESEEAVLSFTCKFDPFVTPTEDNVKLQGSVSRLVSLNSRLSDRDVGKPQLGNLPEYPFIAHRIDYILNAYGFVREDMTPQAREGQSEPIPYSKSPTRIQEYIVNRYIGQDATIKELDEGILKADGVPQTVVEAARKACRYYEANPSEERPKENQAQRLPVQETRPKSLIELFERNLAYDVFEDFDSQLTVRWPDAQPVWTDSKKEANYFWPGINFWARLRTEEGEVWNGMVEVSLASSHFGDSAGKKDKHATSEVPKEFVKNIDAVMSAFGLSRQIVFEELDFNPIVIPENIYHALRYTEATGDTTHHWSRADDAEIWNKTLDLIHKKTGSDKVRINFVHPSGFRYETGEKIFVVSVATDKVKQERLWNYEQAELSNFQKIVMTEFFRQPLHMVDNALSLLVEDYEYLPKSLLTAAMQQFNHFQDEQTNEQTKRLSR